MTFIQFLPSCPVSLQPILPLRSYHCISPKAPKPLLSYIIFHHTQSTKKPNCGEPNADRAANHWKQVLQLMHFLLSKLHV